MQPINVWKILIDPDNSGVEKGWHEFCCKSAKNAVVPGIIQQHFCGYNGLAWYWTEFDSNRKIKTDHRCVLRFEAVDYSAKVWVNGQFVGSNTSSEAPFEFDITPLLSKSGRNLIAVRVLNPTYKPIDGIELKYTPHCHRADKDFMPGKMMNVGGIVGPVKIYYPPAVRINNVHVTPDYKTGTVACKITIDNAFDKSRQVELSCGVWDSDGQPCSDEKNRNINCSQGTSTHSLTLLIEEFNLWQLEDPYLYTLNVALKVSRRDNLEDSRNVRFGFREFKVMNGYFFLNDKRIFIRSGHTCNHFPVGSIVATDKKNIQRDLINAKACGMNMIRFIAKMAMPEQLDFCDEIGLLVYQETMAGWNMADSDQMADNLNHAVCDMIIRDRNHPSVVAWGLLNETFDGPVFRHAQKMLPLMRRHDKSRMVFLNSGRFDLDKTVGSFSNPYSDTWECQWALESPKSQKFQGDPNCTSEIMCEPANEYPHYMGVMGDIHIYPAVPQLEDSTVKIKNIGQGPKCKPTFVSEYGVGSLFHAINELRYFRQSKTPANLADHKQLTTMAEKFINDWHKYGMEEVYPFPEDMLTASRIENLKQRRDCFDLIRSNPSFCGYSLTGLLDHGFVGEGIWSFADRKFKEGLFDVVSEGFSPLKWCLFAWPKNAFAGKSFEIEAVLANEDVLKAGNYQAKFAISNDVETIWRKDVKFKITKHKGQVLFATPVMREKIKLTAPGRYRLSASLDKGLASCRPREFFVTTAAEKLAKPIRVDSVGLSVRLHKWLEKKNVKCTPIRTDSPIDSGNVLIVGDSKIAKGSWERILHAVRKGATAIFISPEIFEDPDFSVNCLKFEKPLVAKKNADWLYHKEFIAKNHEIFDNLCGPGVMDMDFFGPVLGQYMFEAQKLPARIIAGAFIIGYVCKDGYDSGVLACEYDMGKGKIVCNSFNLIHSITQHPAADKMLMNFVYHYF